VPNGTQTKSGGTVIGADASSDVGAAQAALPHDSRSATSAASPLTATGTVSTLTLTPGTGQSQTVQASTDSTTCPGPTPAKQPCADGRLLNGSTPGITMNLGGPTLALVSQANTATSSIARVTRFLTAAGSSSLGCATATGANAGCISAQAWRSFGTIQLGTLTGSTAAGASGLVEISGYGDSAASEYGVNSLAVAPAVTRTGTVSIWTGSGRLPITLTPTTSRTDVSAPVTYTNGSRRVTARASVTVQPYSAQRTNTDAACVAANCSLDTNASSVTVSVLYEVTDSAGTSAFTVVTDLGSLRASSSYKAAP
jgi:hypothetical protein